MKSILEMDEFEEIKHYLKMEIEFYEVEKKQINLKPMILEYLWKYPHIKREQIDKILLEISGELPQITIYSHCLVEYDKE